MTTIRARLLLTGIGAAVGLAGALAWWLLWGCRACARDATPWSAIVFSSVVGVGTAHAWGMDHLRHRR